MKGLDVKNFDDLKDVFKMMVGEMLENGLDGELDDELGYTKYDYRNTEWCYTKKVDTNMQNMI